MAKLNYAKLATASVFEAALIIAALLIVAPTVIGFLGGVAQPLPITDMVGQGITLAVSIAAVKVAESAGLLKIIGM